MDGKWKSAESSSEDDESAAKTHVHDDGRDPSQLRDLLEKAKTNEENNEGIRLAKKQNKTVSNVAIIVGETTKKTIQLERLDSVDSNEGEYSLHDLSREGNIEEMSRLLLKLSENEELLSKTINEADEEKFTALHYATRYNHYHAARLLVQYGADVRARGEGDITPLHYCARYKPPPLSARIRYQSTSADATKKEQMKLDSRVDAGGSFFTDNGGSDEYYTCRQSLLGSARLSSRLGLNHTPFSLGLPSIASSHLFDDDPKEQTVRIISLLIQHGADIEAVDKAGQTPLHYAASQGNDAFVGELLRWDANVNASDRQLQTPLHAACSSGSFVVCRQLLDAGASIDCPDCENKTPLHTASQFDKLSIVQLLLDQMNPSADGCKDQAALTLNRMRFAQFVDARDQENSTPLMLAVESRSFPIADLLLKQGADVNATRKGNIRCLHLASQNGDISIIDLLIDHGAKLDCRNLEQQTPLHLACAKDKEESVQRLIDRGAEVRLRDKQGRTPLLTAVVVGSLSCLKCVVKNSLWAIEDTDKSDRTALFLAAKHDRLEIVKYLLTSKVGEGESRSETECLGDVCHLIENVWLIGRDQLEYPDRDDNTPLHIAAFKGYSDIVECLLSSGAAADAKNENERTPIHLAAEEGCVRVVRFLAGNEKSRKTIFDQDEDSNTPLHLAAKRGNALVAKALLDFGADVKARNLKYWTPLDYAAERGWSTTTMILLDHKAPVNLVDKTKSSPLHIACRAGHVSIVNMLLERKADVKALDCDSRNCLDLSIQNEHRQVAIALLSHEDWKSMLTHAYVDPELKIRQTPLRALIKKFPDVAKMVFDKCTSVNELSPEHPNFEVTYDYELLEDTYSHWESADKVDSYDGKHRLQSNVRPYSEIAAEVKRYHPLMIMVRREREELLDHPLVRSLLKHKWRSYGRYVYYSMLLIYLLFLTSLTAYVATARPPYYTYQSTPLDVVPLLDKKDFCTRVLENATTAEQLVVDFAFSQQAAHVLAAKHMILLLAIFNLIKEGVQLYLRRLKYFTFENCIELFIYFAGFVFVIDFTPCSQVTGYRMGWQWQLGAFAVFLAWFNLILFASKLPRFGIYVVMFIDVSRTFSQFFLLYSLFIVAFALTFFALFQNQHPFSTVGSSIVKTMVMMVGEFDYEGIFTPVDQSYGDQVFYYKASNIFFALFVVVMTILVMNLLIGLAVDDIKTIQQQAVLKRLALQVEQVLDVEQLIPERFRRRLVISQESVYPNRQLGFRWLASVLSAFLGFPAAAASRVANARTATAGQLADRKLRSLLESTNNKLDQLTRAVEGVQKEQRRLKKMVMSLSEKSRIEAETEEDQDYLGQLF